MIFTYKDFATNEELEKFQKENKIKVIKAETVQKERWIGEYFKPNARHTQGFKKYTEVRLFFENLPSQKK